MPPARTTASTRRSFELRIGWSNRHIARQLDIHREMVGRYLRLALARILEAVIAKELRPWVRTFEPDFYQELMAVTVLMRAFDDFNTFKKALEPLTAET